MLVIGLHRENESYQGPHEILKHNRLYINLDFVNMEDAHRMSWLFTYGTFILTSYLEKAGER